MSANRPSPPRLKLRTDEFDKAADDWFGHVPDGQVADRLGVDATSLSLFRRGHRSPSQRFVAAVLDQKDATFERFFTYGELNDEADVA